MELFRTIYCHSQTLLSVPWSAFQHVTTKNRVLCRSLNTYVPCTEKKCGEGNSEIMVQGILF